jgi:hypothetical protein
VDALSFCLLSYWRDIPWCCMYVQRNTVLRPLKRSFVSNTNFRDEIMPDSLQTLHLYANDRGNYSYKGINYSVHWLILFTIPTKTYYHHVKYIRYNSQHPHYRQIISALHIKRSSYRLLIYANTKFHMLSPSSSLVMDIKERNYAATVLLLHSLKKDPSKTHFIFFSHLFVAGFQWH